MRAWIVVLLLLSGTARAETLLRLSETARVASRPDELAAVLRVEAQKPSAAAVQDAVNAAMAKALARAKGVAGISVSTGWYQVFQVTQPTRTWQGAQTIEVHGADGAAVLGLVGALQEQGLAVQGLNWRLTAEAMQKAREVATGKALAGLRSRADAAAKVLGLTFERFAEVRLDGGQGPRPVTRMVVGAAMAAPVAEAADVDVSATVEADVVLK